MHRLSVLSLLVLAACAGHTAPPPEPGPAVAAPSAAAAPTVAQAIPEPDLVPAPVADSVLDRELLEELRIAADSAADEDILDKLADLHTETPDREEPAAEEAPVSADGSKALGTAPVTFDIEVERFNTTTGSSTTSTSSARRGGSASASGSSGCRAMRR